MFHVEQIMEVLIMNEVWKDVVGYEGLYQVSNLGRVKSLNYKRTGKEKLLEPILLNTGYLIVNLCNNNTQKTFTVHRLVTQAFIENPTGRPCIDHINTIKTDNRACNLRWVTYKENNDNSLTKERHRISCIEARAKKVFCENTIYDSITQCAEHYGAKRNTMSQWLTGVRTMPTDFQAKGLRYYIEEEK